MIKKIIIAPDSFKGSLTALEVVETIRNSLNKYCKPLPYIVKLPMSDGGEGFLDCIRTVSMGYDNKTLLIKVDGADNEPLTSELYKTIQDEYFIESAKVVGYNLEYSTQLDPLTSTTKGIGQLLKYVLQKDPFTINIGVGGTITNDCGIGLASELGYVFLDKNGKTLEPIAKNLIKVDKIEFNEEFEIPQKRVVKAICDVDNVLFGEEGATQVFGKQKGVTESNQSLLEDGIINFADKINECLDVDLTKVKGGGAGGGLGAALVAFCNAEIVSGVEFILDFVSFDKLLKTCDLIITGEGRMDSQTSYGKVPYGIAQRVQNSRIYNDAKVVAIVGENKVDEATYKEWGISEVVQLVDGKNVTLEDSMENASELIFEATKSFFVN
ncbi:MAG: glycerate kinase [Bacteroidales bacterium]|jgi:glycerate kinase